MYKTFSSSSLSERISDVTGEGLIGLKEWFCGKWRNGDEFDFLGGCGIDAGGGEAGVNRNCFGGPDIASVDEDRVRVRVRTTD